MEKLIFYLVAAIVVIYVLMYVIGIILAIGLGIIGIIALAGAVTGLFFGITNFFALLIDVHQKLPLPNRVPMMNWMDKLYRPQPAHPLYPFAGGWQVMDYVAQNLISTINPDARRWFNWASDAQRNAEFESSMLKKYLITASYIGMYIAGAMNYIFAFLFAGLFLMLHFTVLILWMTLSFLAIGFLSLVSFVVSDVYRIFYRCPTCHEQMMISTYMCPNCFTEHTRLWPSTYGFLYHTCECGQKLPVFDFLGRNKLEQKCAVCNTPMNSAVGGHTNFHIPVIGGPNTGKSNFIFQAAHTLVDCYADEHNLDISFPDQKHLVTYKANVNLLGQGKVINKTTDIVPQAYNLLIKPQKGGIGCLLYLYDAAGEAYSHQENTEQQKPYFSYVDGLIFVVDPFAIDHYAIVHEEEIESQRKLIRPADIGVKETYARMIKLMEDCLGTSSNERFPQPLAVVLTKTDAINMPQLVGPDAVRNYQKKHPEVAKGKEYEVTNSLVREFLVNNQEGNLVRALEARFDNVRYFACSALGRLPEDGSAQPFNAVGVLEPVLWILSQSKVLNFAREVANLPTVPK